MIFTETSLKGAFIIDLEPFKDERGLFARTFDKKEFESIGHDKEFVQFNHSVNTTKGTLRGLHYQIPPSSEIKLIRCVKGVISDVLIDIRAGSTTFLQHIAVELSETNMRMIYIPEGFAHGFQTLTDDCHLIYHHSNFYQPKDERGLRFDDPTLNIQWPMQPTVLSEKDTKYALLAKDFNGIKI